MQIAENSRTLRILKETGEAFSQDECAMMASSLAFYTAFSLPPLLVLVVTVAGWIWSPEAVTEQLEHQVSSVIGEGGWQQVHQMMQAAGEHRGGTIAAVLGVIALLFGAMGVMVQLQAALNKAWEVQPDPDQGGIRNFVVKRVLSLAMICAASFLLLVSLILTAILNAMSNSVSQWLPDGISGWVPFAIDWAVSLVVFSLLFAAMFKWVPDANVRWSDTWVGAIATGLLFIAGKFALGMYFGLTDTGGTYGAAASFVLLLLWVYYSGMIFLFGAEFTKVWARQHGQGIRPAEGAVHVIQQTMQVDDPYSHSTAATQTAPETTEVIDRL